MKDDIIICRCEEITRGEIVSAIREGHHSVSSIKRATRAGMGPCQGRTCSDLIRRILAEEGVSPTTESGIDKFRFPLLPVSFTEMQETVKESTDEV